MLTGECEATRPGWSSGTYLPLPPDSSRISSGQPCGADSGCLREQEADKKQAAGKEKTAEGGGQGEAGPSPRPRLAASSATHLAPLVETKSK